MAHTRNERNILVYNRNAFCLCQNGEHVLGAVAAHLKCRFDCVPLRHATCIAFILFEHIFVASRWRVAPFATSALHQREAVLVSFCARSSRKSTLNINMNMCEAIRTYFWTYDMTSSVPASAKLSEPWKRFDEIAARFLWPWPKNYIQRNAYKREEFNKRLSTQRNECEIFYVFSIRASCSLTTRCFCLSVLFVVPFSISLSFFFVCESHATLSLTFRGSSRLVMWCCSNVRHKLKNVLINSMCACAILANELSAQYVCTCKHSTWTRILFMSNAFNFSSIKLLTQRALSALLYWNRQA